MTKTTITQAFCSEGTEWVKEFDVNITKELIKRINKARDLLKNDINISSININLPDCFWIDEEHYKLYESGAFYVAYIIVCRNAYYLYIQSKWNSSDQAEYEINI